MLLMFLFHLFHISKRYPLRTFLIGETKKVACDQVNRRVGHVSHPIFGQKLLNTQCSVGRCAHKSPIKKWANALKESSKKNSLKPNAASHNNASWYADTDGFLEHSPSRRSLYYKSPALQKIIPFYLGPPHVLSNHHHNLDYHPQSITPKVPCCPLLSVRLLPLLSRRSK